MKFINELENRLSKRNIKINLKEEAIKAISENGFDSLYGARPLKRFIQKEIETPLAMMIIKGVIKDNQEVIIDYINNEFIIK